MLAIVGAGILPARLTMTNLVHPYILTTALLVAHQIDSAYWREWTLFGIPGGIQAFVLLNLPLALVVLAGLAKVAAGASRAAGYSLSLALVGIATCFIHLGFAWRGHPEFGVPVSWMILGETLLASVWLGWRSLGVLRSHRS